MLVANLWRNERSAGMKVESRGEQWAVVYPSGWVAGIFDTNAAAWKWVDRNTDQGEDDGDHAGRQDWSIRQNLNAE